MSAPSALPRADVLGTRVTASSFADAVAALAGCVARREPAVFSAATVYSVMLGHDDPGFRALVNAADYVMADGVPLVWAARVLGHAAERVHGDDLMLACCAAHPGWRHFLLGGAPGQPDVVRAALAARVPGIQVVGARATPVRPLPDAEARRALEEVEAAGADVVWVGMGTPAQDRFMAAYRERAGRPLVGVGSAFDLLAGRTRPTPAWMRQSGLQWVHRWAQEPGRLTRRYAVHNPRFVWHVGRSLLSGTAPRG